MILQSLNDFYIRKCNATDPKDRLPEFGVELKEIPFVIAITKNGEFVELIDARRQDGKRKVGKKELVPQGVKKTSGVAANLLWDTLEYTLGVDTRGKPERVAEQHAAFIERINGLPAEVFQNEGIQAVLKFLENNPIEKLECHSLWPEIVESNPIITFKIKGELGLICQAPEIIRAVVSTDDSDTEEARVATCLITGKKAAVQRLHTSIKGVWGAQTAGANIVSFNARAFESYGKTGRQGENAPISEQAAFAYTTALNYLLDKNNRQRTQIGDASTVFWADKKNDIETSIVDIFGEKNEDNPTAGTDKLKQMYEAVQQGKWVKTDDGNRLHVLGLSPNAARISIRFYYCLTLRELAERVTSYFNDLKLNGGNFDPEFPSLFRLLTSIALQGKADNIPPNLAGAIVQAIFSGPNSQLPALWLNTAINRCRAEQEVSYLRAASIKACLNRQIRRQINPHEQEFQPMLDPNNKNVAYRLGRLFAVLEKIQYDTNPNLNSTIRDRYYNAASSTPVTVFTTLLRLKNAHLKQLTESLRGWHEKNIGEIMNSIDDFPNHLTLPDQGRFALGYYHQRQYFFTRSEQSTTAKVITEGMES